MRLQAFHLPFLQSLDGGAALTFTDYLNLVLRRPTRVWWGGEVRFLAAALHPISGAPGVFAWTVYTEDTAGNRLVTDDIRAGFSVMTACAPAFAASFAFVPSSNEQRQTAAAAVDELAGEGIAVFLP
jgi:hypothetical protein